MMLNSEQIKEIIPHRYPFLLVDKIVDMEPGQWAKGIKCVSANEMYFMGHFPERQIMPGVRIVEALVPVFRINTSLRYISTPGLISFMAVTTGIFNFLLTAAHKEPQATPYLPATYAGPATNASGL